MTLGLWRKDHMGQGWLWNIRGPSFPALAVALLCDNTTSSGSSSINIIYHKSSVALPITHVISVALLFLHHYQICNCNFPESDEARGVKVRPCRTLKVAPAGEQGWGFQTINSYFSSIIQNIGKPCIFPHLYLLRINKSKPSLTHY